MNSKNYYTRYSEAFKSQVLTEIESGALTIPQAKSKYGIRGTNTITSWARKFGRFGIVPKLIRVETPNERDETQALKEENKRLKLVIAELVMDRKIAESTLEVLCEQQGWDIDQIKKKSWHPIAEKVIRQGEKVSHVCNRFKKSRAAFYKQIKQEMQQQLMDPVISELVMEQRKLMPHLGGKKLYHLIKAPIQQHSIKMGRDKLFLWLKKEDLLVRRKKRYTKTTHSTHRFRVHKNLIKNVPITDPDQCWVSDITYLRLQHGFCYLALITDAYSRKIIGFDVSQSLELTGCMRALKMACADRKRKSTIHHSDRGLQYCSYPYIDVLRENGIDVSMGEVGNCYDNAMAERVNGILKTEFNLDATFRDIGHAQKAAKEAIYIYNEKRPHMAIGLKMPTELYAA